MNRLLTPILLALALATAARADGPAVHVPSADELALGKKFAPLVVLAKDEPYLPSSIEYHAQFTSLKCPKGATGTVLAPKGAPDDGCHLTTNEKMKGPDQILGFFHGQDPRKTQVPIYAGFYKATKSGALNIHYRTFFPYNWGKNVCLSLAPKDHCLAKRHQMDNHVGDWEGVTVQVKAGKLVGVRVGAHSASKIGFTFRDGAKGGCPSESGDNEFGKVWPLSCIAQRDGHPVVYAAWGSHGIWGNAGSHNYQTLPTGERLVDHTSAGLEWKTWEKVVPADPSVYPFKYPGRWGNASDSVPGNSNACKLSSVPGKLCGPAGIPTDEFELNPGPGAPDLNRDWEKLD